MKRAYLLFAVGQSYIDKVQILVDYLLRYSAYDIVLCYSEGTVKFTNKRLVSIPMSIDYVIDFNVPPHKPTSVRYMYLMSFKPIACQLAIGLNDIKYMYRLNQLLVDMQFKKPTLMNLYIWIRMYYPLQTLIRCLIYGHVNVHCILC